MTLTPSRSTITDHGLDDLVLVVLANLVEHVDFLDRAWLKHRDWCEEHDLANGRSDTVGWDQGPWPGVEDEHGNRIFEWVWLGAYRPDGSLRCTAKFLDTNIQAVKDALGRLAKQLRVTAP